MPVTLSIMPDTIPPKASWLSLTKALIASTDGSGGSVPWAIVSQKKATGGSDSVGHKVGGGVSRSP